MPVTSFQHVVSGRKVDFVFYANNYEQPGPEHPVIEQFASAENALEIFSKGTVMSKGTTTSTGIVSSYFANIFGPVQYRLQHEEIAARYFKAFFNNNMFVGQIRTGLGLSGHEHSGPELAAKELLNLVLKRQVD